MKKTVLSLFGVMAALSASSAWAAITIDATTPSQNGNAGGTVNVSFTLTVDGTGSDPAEVTGYDLYLATASANSGFFSLTLAAPSKGSPFTSSGPTNPENDPLNKDAASGFVRNGKDQGFSGGVETTPFSNLPLETLTLSIAANTPAGTYDFTTTTLANAGDFFTSVSTGEGTQAVDNAGTFSIVVVPEPGTGATLAAGALGLLALGGARRLLASGGRV